MRLHKMCGFIFTGIANGTSHEICTDIGLCAYVNQKTNFGHQDNIFQERFDQVLEIVVVTFKFHKNNLLLN
jgi:hypothetical protein